MRVGAGPATAAADASEGEGAAANAEEAAAARLANVRRRIHRAPLPRSSSAVAADADAPGLRTESEAGHPNLRIIKASRVHNNNAIWHMVVPSYMHPVDFFSKERYDTHIDLWTKDNAVTEKKSTLDRCYTALGRIPTSVFVPGKGECKPVLNARTDGKAKLPPGTGKDIRGALNCDCPENTKRCIQYLLKEFSFHPAPVNETDHGWHTRFVRSTPRLLHCTCILACVAKCFRQMFLEMSLSVEGTATCVGTVHRW